MPPEQETHLQDLSVLDAQHGELAVVADSDLATARDHRQDYLPLLDWLVASGRRSALRAFAGFAAWNIVILLLASLPLLIDRPWLIGGAQDDGLHAYTLWALAAIFGGQMVWLGWRYSLALPRLAQRLELAGLADRVAAGLLADHSRAKEYYRNWPARRAQLTRAPKFQLAYLLVHLDFYVGSAPITPAAAPWVVWLIVLGGGGLLLAVLLPMLLIGQPVLLLYLSFIPVALARQRVDLAPQASVLCHYLRKEWGKASDLAAPVLPPLPVLERRALFPMDINQLDMDLSRVIPGYGASGNLLGPAVALLLGATGVVAGLVYGWPVLTGFGVLLLAATLAIQRWLRLEGTHYRGRIRRWLEESGLLVNIALEELTAERFSERLGPFMRALQGRMQARGLGRGQYVRLTHYASGLKRTLWTVAQNASWLEAGLKPLQNAAFVGAVLVPIYFVVVFPLIGVLLSIEDGLSGLPEWTYPVLFPLLTAIVLAPLLLPTMLLMLRRRIAAEEFIALLRARLLEE